MGTTLEGKQINQTYQGLLKTTDNNEVGASAKEITDGRGNGTGVTLDNSGNIVANATVTANSFVGDGSQLTGLPVTSVNTQTGDVVLDADNISDTSTTNKFTTAADISKLANIEANADVTDVANVTTALNSISATELSDITDVGSGSVITGVERTKLDSVEDNAQVNPTDAQIKASYESNTNTNAFTDALKSKLQNIEAGAEVNNINSVNGQVGTITLGLLNLDDVGADGASGEVLTTDGQGNFTFAPAGGGEGFVTRVNGATGNVVLDTDDIDEGTTNLYYTEARVSANTDVATNTAKVGITQSQADAIVANTAKVGITTGQSDAIIANTAKNSYPSADATKVGFITVTQAVDLDTLESDVATNNAKVGITTQQANEIAANTLKTGITTEQANAITANTAKVGITAQQAADITTNNSKVGITTQQAADIVTNNAKVGITTQQASDIIANNAKVGITTQQASDITANNAKISFDSASSTKLAGIEDGAEVNPTASEIKTSYESNNDTNAFTDAEKTKLSGIAENAEVNVNADWNATTGDAQILNKPTLATVATTGAYSDLSGTPSLATVATSGSYTDLSNTPTIPTNNNELTNGAGYITDGNTGWNNTYGFITASTTDTLTNKSGSNNQWTNDAGYINEAAQTSHTNAIGNAIDFSARVTLAGGVAEGTSGIIKNLQSIS
jgi:hypothetical protein